MNYQYEYCWNGCCEYIIDHGAEKVFSFKGQKEKMKGGVLVRCPNTNRVLVVRSAYQDIWGIPKGTKEENETFEECAFRELKEETGIDRSELTNVRVFNARKNFVFYYGEMLERDIFFSKDTDVSGVAWINLDCITASEFEGMNRYAKITFTLYNKDVQERRRSQQSARYNAQRNNSSWRNQSWRNQSWRNQSWKDNSWRNQYWKGNFSWRNESWRPKRESELPPRDTERPRDTEISWRNTSN
jgi:8-oxo-dGTP pyrophosphatase MutT (NUDIX family)